MVATRRQVQIGPDEELVLEQDPDQLLKKNAARKTADKTIASTKTATRAKSAARGKQIPQDSVEEPSKQAKRPGRPKKILTESEPALDAEDNIAGAKMTRATKGGSVRTRKATKVLEDAPIEEESKKTKPTKSTKTGTVKGRKAASAVDEPTEEIVSQGKGVGNTSLRGRRAAAAAQAPLLAAPQDPKTTRSTRGASTSAPLSPKKITQVNKVPAKTVKTANQPNTKPTTRTTRNNTRAVAAPGRKTPVSDENAGIQEQDTAADIADGDGNVQVLQNTSTKASETSRKGAKRDRPSATVESEASMSSGPTTPTDSPVQKFDAFEGESGQQEDVEPASEAEQSDVEIGDVSEDELCGPKTPMRRSSPSALARYQSSVQRTVRKYENESRMATPVIRYAVLGTQLGTPQTEKPYCKPIAPSSSDLEPMTVSRAEGRSFVFKDIRDGRPTIKQANDSADEPEEPSFILDEGIIPLDAAEPTGEDSVVASPPHPTIPIDKAQLIASSLVEEDAEDYVVPANVQKYSDDPDDTVVMMDDEDVMAVSTEYPTEPYNAEDNVIVTSANASEESEEMAETEIESDDGSVIVHSIQPVTNNGSSTAASIAVNFDDHLNDGRLQSGLNVVHPEQPLAVEPSVHHDHDAGYDESDLEASILSNVSRRDTLDLNDFVDVGALSENTIRVELGEMAAPAADIESHILSVSKNHGDEMLLSEVAIEGAESSNVAANFESSLDARVQTDVPQTPNSTGRRETGSYDMEKDLEEPQIPHYALPTIAFDARRKSLPVLSLRTPTQTRTRPSTADGASMPRIANPFSNAWWSRPDGKPIGVTPSKTRPSTAHASGKASVFNTPVRSRQLLVTDSTVKTPRESSLAYPSSHLYGGHRTTVAAPIRFATPKQNSPKRRETFHKAATGKSVTRAPDTVESTSATPVRVIATTPQERYPALRARQNYEDHAKTVAGPVRFQTPPNGMSNRRQTFHRALPGLKVDAAASEPAEPKTPGTDSKGSTQERYPRLRPKADYEEHAKTVAAPTRFQTPARRVLKRPATVGKADSLRIAALAANMPVPSHTPTKTPLKAAAMTPSQAPLTPHPAAPLREVVALVEVFTLEGASASAPFISLLHRLGAKTTRSWNERITHVVFKDGSPTTLQRVRLNNKDFEESGKGGYIHCVNSRWVTDCDAEGARVHESGDAYVVDVAEIPRGGKRRRKSMEPAALLNFGGNIVRERKSSGGRVSSIGRSPLKLIESPAQASEVEVGTSSGGVMGKENSGDEQSSPVTPAWIAAPGQLVQRTAPMKRVRKLELPGKGEAKSRRLTFWNGAA